MSIEQAEKEGGTSRRKRKAEKAGGMEGGISRRNR
jgi:hypothetical protein